MLRLAQIEAFPEEYCAAARAVATAMAAVDRAPNEYTVEVSPVARGLLEFYARHDCHPAGWSGRGDACGKCCLVRYSPKTGRVLRIVGIR